MLLRVNWGTSDLTKLMDGSGNLIEMHLAKKKLNFISQRNDSYGFT